MNSIEPGGIVVKNERRHVKRFFQAILMIRQVSSAQKLPQSITFHIIAPNNIYKPYILPCLTQ